MNRLRRRAILLVFCLVLGLVVSVARDYQPKLKDPRQIPTKQVPTTAAQLNADRVPPQRLIPFGTFYFRQGGSDSAACSNAAPCLSLKKAAVVLEANLGGTALFGAGTWNTPDEWNPAGAWNTINAGNTYGGYNLWPSHSLITAEDPNNRPTWTCPTGMTTADACMSFYNKTDITITDINMTGEGQKTNAELAGHACGFTSNFGTQCSFISFYDRTSDIIFEDMDIGGANKSCIFGYSKTSANDTRARLSNFRFTRLRVHNCGKMQDTGSYDHGFYFKDIDGLVVEDSEIDTNAAMGFQIQSDIATGASNPGDAGYAINVTVRRNYIHGNGDRVAGGGVYLNRATTSTIIENNVIVSNGAGIIAGAAAYGVIVRHNTIWANNLAPVYTTGGDSFRTILAFFPSLGGDWTIANNIMGGQTGTGPYGTGVFYAGAGSTVRGTNNIVVGTGLNGGGTNALVGTITTAPTFTSSGTGDYTLQAASSGLNVAIDTATGYASPTVSVDRAGNTRPGGGLNDIGAYERGASSGSTIPSVGAGCTRIEAESITPTGTIPTESSLTDASGGSYKTWASVSTALDYSIGATSTGSGSGTVKVRYQSAGGTRTNYIANPSATSQTMTFTASTGAWNVVQVTHTFVQGVTNSLSLSYDPSNSGTVYIDYIEVCPPAYVPPGTTTTTSTTTTSTTTTTVAVTTTTTTPALRSVTLTAFIDLNLDGVRQSGEPYMKRTRYVFTNLSTGKTALSGIFDAPVTVTPTGNVSMRINLYTPLSPTNSAVRLVAEGTSSISIGGCCAS